MRFLNIKFNLLLLREHLYSLLCLLHLSRNYASYEFKKLFYTKILLIFLAFPLSQTQLPLC